jgi:hypothetical protein
MARSSPTSPGGAATDRHAARLAELRRVVFDSVAATDRAVRAAAASGAALAEPAGSYAAKVRDASYRMTGADLGGLHAAGLSDDAVFEITIAAAVGAALRSLDAGMRAVREQA